MKKSQTQAAWLLLAVTSILFCAQIVVAAEALFSDRVVVLRQEEEQWQIKVRFDEQRDSIFFRYTSGTGEVLKSTVQTHLYSDTAPTAALVDKTPILAWSSIATADSDSDIYFAIWTGRDWSAPQMVHKDNNLADMKPKLNWDHAGQLTLSWWRNTGTTIIQMQAVYNEGAWIVQNDTGVVEGQRKEATRNTSYYYHSLPPIKVGDPPRCIALGDSITAGCKRPIDYYWCENERTGETTGGYVDTLLILLRKVYTNSQVYNYGNPGERSYEGVLRTSSVLAAQPNANCVLIMYGANDRYEELHPTSTSANIKLMADLALAAGMAPVITTISPNTSVWGIESYNDKIRELADYYGIIMADQYSALKPDWSKNNSGDGVHLSDAGDVIAGIEWYTTLIENEMVVPARTLDSILLLLRQ